MSKPTRWLLLLIGIGSAIAWGGVERVEISNCTSLMNGYLFKNTDPYEFLEGQLHFALDPTAAENRGGDTFSVFNFTTQRLMENPQDMPPFGDGFLMERGYKDQGAPSEMAALVGSFLPFPRHEAERQQWGIPVALSPPPAHRKMPTWDGTWCMRNRWHPLLLCHKRRLADLWFNEPVSPSGWTLMDKYEGDRDDLDDFVPRLGAFAEQCIDTGGVGIGTPRLVKLLGQRRDAGPCQWHPTVGPSRRMDRSAV